MNKLAVALIIAATVGLTSSACAAEKAKWYKVENPQHRACDTDSDCAHAILEMGCVEAEESHLMHVVVLCPVFPKIKAVKLTKMGRYCLKNECE